MDTFDKLQCQTFAPETRRTFTQPQDLIVLSTTTTRSPVFSITWVAESTFVSLHTSAVLLFLGFSKCDTLLVLSPLRGRLVLPGAVPWDTDMETSGAAQC